MYHMGNIKTTNCPECETDIQIDLDNLSDEFMCHKCECEFYVDYPIEENTSSTTRIICIADTHLLHEKIEYPQGDILIVAGDITPLGNGYDTKNVLRFLSQLKYKHIILIAGNHDFWFEDYPLAEEITKTYNITYLNDSGVTINGIKFWGSPVSPEFCNWAFNRSQLQLRKHWNLIPKDTDVLITHTPPYSILDQNKSKHNCGCKELLKRINIIKPKYSIFGHIHESYGSLIQNDITFINCSVVDENYKVVNKPVVVEIRK